MMWMLIWAMVVVESTSSSSTTTATNTTEAVGPDRWLLSSTQRLQSVQRAIAVLGIIAGVKTLAKVDGRARTVKFRQSNGVPESCDQGHDLSAAAAALGENATCSYQRVTLDYILS
jgi:hypothetical protein